MVLRLTERGFQRPKAASKFTKFSQYRTEFEWHPVYLRVKFRHRRPARGIYRRLRGRLRLRPLSQGKAMARYHSKQHSLDLAEAEARIEKQISRLPPGACDALEQKIGQLQVAASWNAVLSVPPFKTPRAR